MNFKGKVMLAPMAGVTDIAFRKLCTDYGADIVYSQMIDSRALSHGNSRLIDFFDEKNLIAQLLGDNARTMAECAKKLEGKAAAIDINIGCPKATAQKAGAWLMRKPEKVAEIVRKIVKAADAPVTAKIRAGYDKKHLNAVEIARICEENGAEAIAVHGRAMGEGYGKAVRYDIIRKVKENVSIAVIGNGGIFSGKDAERMYRETGCDSIMIGRGAIGNPAIFEEVKDFLEGEKWVKREKNDMFQEYLRYAKRYNVEFSQIKLHGQWFTKGVIGGARLRDRIGRAKEVEEIGKIWGLTD